MLSIDVLRMVTCRALRGRTWALDRVEDSPAETADIRIEADRSPFIAVFSDEADTEKLMREHEEISLSSPLTVDLILECGIASSYEIEPAQPGDDSPRPDPTVVTSVNGTDGGLELSIGLLAQQAVNCLQAVGPTSPWSEIWRQLTNGGKLSRLRVVRGGPQADTKTPRFRYASRLVIMSLEMTAVPPRGANIAEYPAWALFFNAAAGDEELRDVSKLVLAHLQQGDGAPAPQIETDQKVLGITTEAMGMLGIGPVKRLDDQPGTPHPLATVTAAPVPYGGRPPVDHGGQEASGEPNPEDQLYPKGFIYE